MQEGSKKMKKYIFSALKVILIVLIATALTINLFKTDKTVSAGEYTITVNKVSTVSVYVSGPGVMLESTDTDKDVYRVDQGTTARFHAVNESRIFTGWVIRNGETVVNDSTSAITTQVVNSNLTVSVTRRDATTADYGKYMLDRYVISDEAELLALQNILAGTEANPASDADYAHFYDDATAYNTTTKKNTIRAAMNTGYYLIANNFVVFNSSFKGLGTIDTPFQGVVCGLNNSIVSSIFSTVSVTETGGTNGYGLFKALGDNAVIRNLNVVTTVGMTAATSNVTNGVQYIGGLAGHMRNSLLVNVTVEAKMGINVRNSQVHVGGIVGYTTGSGFESVGNVKYNGDSTSWTVQSTAGATINAGLVAGYAQNVYVNSMNINVTDSVVDLKADNSSASTAISLGNLFGRYECTKTNTLKNINIVGSRGQILRTVLEGGESAVGGLIGRVTASTSGQYLNIGKVDFNVLGSKSTYMSSTAGSSSTANLYTAGLIGYINGSNCIALDSFKNRLSEVTVDESKVKVFDYLFEGDYEITSVQNGTASSTSQCKSIAGGLVGKGIIDIDGGSNSTRSSLAFTSPSSSLKINATQSKFTDTTDTLNDKEHACAALIYGSNGSTALNINGVDIYTNNTTIETLREIGSKAMGDLHTGTFIGYVNNSTLQNIGLYLNNSALLARSLSYEKDAKNSSDDTNSAFCGGLVGQATASSTLNNITFAGYDIVTAEIVGTTSIMESIQNTVPGGDNYRGENYIGGIVGRIQKVTVSNCKYIGSESGTDYIRMSGHESPDSAFCGGIIGMIRTGANDTQSSVSNCSIYNANVYGAATVLTSAKISNPDIYIGGIVGAAYLHSTNAGLTISNCLVSKTNVYALGNEDIAIYVGGVIGGSTWEQSCTINNCYVKDSSVMASSNSTSKVDEESAAGGIIGLKGTSTSVSVNYCAVIDTTVEATSNHSSVTSRAAGIGATTESSSNFKVVNSYSNASLSSSGTNHETYPIASLLSDTSSSNFYISANVNGATDSYSSTTAVTSGPFTVDTSNKTIYSSIYTGDYDEGQKLYIVTNSSYFTATCNQNSAVSVKATTTSSYRATVADVWINATQNGSATAPTSYATEEEANAAGWFIIDRVVIVNNATSSGVTSNVTNIDSSYFNEQYTYEYEYTSGKHYVVNTVDNTDKIEDNYQESAVTNKVKTYTLKVYDDMLSLRINFDLTNVAAGYQLVFKNASGTVVDSVDATNTYGKVTFNKLSNTNYELVFDPNEVIESDTSFTVEIHVGNTNGIADVSFKFDLVANKINIVGITYADYTPPLNYYITDNTLGTSSEPYQLYVGSITKFIPVISKSNDPDKLTIISEDYIERYTYKVSYTGSNPGTIYSSGEFTASSTSGSSGTLTLTDKNDSSKTATVYLTTVAKQTVTYNVIGADIEGLTYATNSTDFYFEQILRSNYSGEPTTATIKVANNKTYNLADSPSVTGVTVYQLYPDGTRSVNPITSWDPDAYGYAFYVTGVSSNVTVTFTYPIVYTITFNLQSGSFNSSYTSTIKYKVTANTSYADFFGYDSVSGTFKTNSIYNKVEEWANGAAIFGYVYKGFYMVDHASTILTYGVAFEDLAKSSNTITASITLYARWSFLIELIEAPGTHIVSSFPSSFMEEHYEEDVFNRSIQIPINLNEGYVFTIEKDKDFKGEASVSAYNVKKEGDSHIITEIVLEKYHENMYLYYVLPEYITGYLVIVTSVSNSEIIVGENTSSVIEEILPEDGVSTFKYIVNHKNIPANGTTPAETSYIFNAGKDIDGDGKTDDDKGYNLTVERDFRLYFYKEVYENGSINKIARELAVGTEIKVFYTIYYNDDKGTTENVVAVYRVENTGVTSVKLNDFTLLDLNTPAFKPETFQKFMEGYQQISEIFYCVVTPPNGLDDNVQGQVVNYIIEGGFYDQNRSEYISGIRSGNELANKDDLNSKDIQDLLIESSKESKVFAVTPSRVTNVTKDGDTYTFVDKVKFEICKIYFQNTKITGNYVSLHDDATQSIIESSELKFDIRELRITLGYGLGKVRIYGYNGTEWKIVEEVNVNNAVYTEYTVDFMDDTYSAFRIDNISTNEIRLNKLDIVSKTNGYVYETTSSHLIKEGGSDSSPTYSLVEYVVGDTRHDSKSFMLAIQLKDSNGIVEDIRGSVSITVGDTTYYALIDQTDSENYGKAVAYINLTSILNTLQTDTIQFTLNLPSGYSVHEMQLVETNNSFKPAMGEVRQSDIK